MLESVALAGVLSGKFHMLQLYIGKFCVVMVTWIDRMAWTGVFFRQVSSYIIISPIFTSSAYHSRKALVKMIKFTGKQKILKLCQCLLQSTSVNFEALV